MSWRGIGLITHVRRGVVGLSGRALFGTDNGASLEIFLDLGR